MINRMCISLNSRCNLKCKYCHFSSKKNNENSKNNEFSLDDIKIFCDNLRKYITSEKIDNFKLGIVGSGEPLLSLEVLKYIVEYFYNSELKNIIKMYTITNGTLLTNEILMFFYKYKEIIELNISFDGDEKTNIELRGYNPNLSLYNEIFGKMPKINAVVTKKIIKNQNDIFEYFIKNKIKEINFSKVFGINDEDMIISDDEYNLFLEKASELGIISRQNTTIKKYDCAKYGKLCGVGRNNIFITKTGVYPCGRFMDNEKYIIGNWNDDIYTINNTLSNIKPCPDGECFYDYYKVGVKK